MKSTVMEGEMINIAIVEDDERELGQLESCIADYGKEHDERFSVASLKTGWRSSTDISTNTTSYSWISTCLMKAGWA